jgi:predicted transcriptional regulator
MPKGIGQAELEVLSYIQDHHPISVREAAEHFARTRGHVRTTTLNVMGRLVSKGYLKRRKVAGVYQYEPRHAKNDLLRRLVSDFVERAGRLAFPLRRLSGRRPAPDRAGPGRAAAARRAARILAVGVRAVNAILGSGSPLDCMARGDDSCLPGGNDRLHNVRRLLLEIVLRTVLWFHPLLWLAGRELWICQESACDEAANRSWRRSRHK